MVASAVVLRRFPLPVRIDDSKRLTAGQRARAFQVILAHADVGFGIVCAHDIDRLNILQATLLAMRQAVEELARAPALVVVDGAQAPVWKFPCCPLVRGDARNYAVACASIMAKVLRDRLMAFYDGLAPRYGFKRHKGYGTALHARRLSALGPSVFHRRSFRPVFEQLRAPPHDASPLDVAAAA